MSFETIAHGVTIEMGGLDAAGEDAEASVEMQGLMAVEAPQSFSLLSHVACRKVVPSALRIRAADVGLQHTVEPGDWHNVWLNGRGIVLVGWISRQELRARGKLIRVGERVFQFDRTRVKNLAVRVGDLHPISELISRA